MSAREPRPGRRRPGRPRGQDSSVVREAVLRAAIDLIAEHGFAATSMAQIAEAAGISPSGLAHHFRSKNALLAAVLAHRDAMDSAPVGGESPWAVHEGLVEIARVNATRHQLVALYTTMIGEAVPPSHPAHEWMVGHYTTTLDLLTAEIEAGIDRGLLRPDAPAEQLARSTVALMDGLQVQWLLDPEVDMPAILEAHVESLKLRWSLPEEGI